VTKPVYSPPQVFSLTPEPNCPVECKTGSSPVTQCWTGHTPAIPGGYCFHGHIETADNPK
jgi:hypothetical protein